MEAWVDLYKECLEMTAERRVELARKQAKVVLDDLQKSFSESQATEILLKGAATFILADGKPNVQEYDLFKAISGSEIGYEEFCRDITNGVDHSTVNAFDSYIESSHRVKKAFVLLGILICACNGEMTKEEKLLVERYYH